MTAGGESTIGGRATLVVRGVGGVGERTSTDPSHLLQKAQRLFRENDQDDSSTARLVK